MGVITTPAVVAMAGAVIIPMRVSTTAVMVPIQESNASVVRSPETKNSWGVWEALDPRSIRPNPADTRSGDIPESSLHILMDTFSKAIKAEVWGKEARIVVLPVRIYV